MALSYLFYRIVGVISKREGENDHISCIQGFPKLTESCSHFSKILPTTVDNKGRLYRE